MGKFALNSDCFLVKGAKRGAIYDLSSGDVYSIDENSTKILDKSEKENSISQIIQEIPNIDPEEIKNYLENLISLNLGIFLEENQTIPAKISLESYPNKLDFVWLELTSKCNFKCIHCYEYEHNRETDSLNVDDWKNIIRELYNLDCRKIQFIGGEPLLFGKDIFILIELAKNLGFELIELFTNGSLLTENNINLLVKYNVCVAVSIYSNKPEIHDQITKRKGSFNKTIKNIKKLSDKGIKFRCSMVVMKQNERDIEKTIKLFKELGSYDLNGPYDIARPIGRSTENILSNKLKSERLQKEPIFRKVTKNNFIKNQNGNSCWQDKLCITPNGNIIPCIMARKEVIGNIKNQRLKDILQKKVLKYWEMSKDKIETCRDCEYRYACNDCRPIVKGKTNCLYAKSPDCLYDPYTGEWKVIKEVIDEKLTSSI